MHYRIEFMVEFCLYIKNHKINSVATCPKQQTLRDKQISSSNLCASGLDGATSFVDVTLEPVPMELLNNETRCWTVSCSQSLDQKK